MNADGSGQRRLVNSAESCGGELGHAWSPDGQKIAFAAWSDQGTDMYVMNADGSGQQRLTSDPSWEGGLAWSPDGRMIAEADAVLATLAVSGRPPTPAPAGWRKHRATELGPAARPSPRAGSSRRIR